MRQPAAGSPCTDTSRPRPPASTPIERNPDPEEDLWYHLTDRPRFALDAEHEPIRNTTIGGTPGARIFLARSPEPWFNGYAYVRAFVAEFHAPGLQPDRGMYGAEKFVPAAQFAQLTLVRVLPYDEWVREEYGEAGPIEFHTDPGMEQPSLPGQLSPRPRRFPDYRYRGPDVRDMSERETARLVGRAEQYIRDLHPQIPAPTVG